MTTSLTFTVAGTAETVAATGFDLVVAEDTGRDEAAVKKHIDELAAIGVPLPAFYALAPELATQADRITVTGSNTSGLPQAGRHHRRAGDRTGLGHDRRRVHSGRQGGTSTARWPHCGTLPLLDGEFVPGAHWSLSLTLPDGVELTHVYSVS
jgi:hypothetical protein